MSARNNFSDGAILIVCTLCLQFIPFYFLAQFIISELFYSQHIVEMARIIVYIPNLETKAKSCYPLFKNALFTCTHYSNTAHVIIWQTIILLSCKRRLVEMPSLIQLPSISRVINETSFSYRLIFFCDQVCTTLSNKSKEGWGWAETSSQISSQIRFG